MYCEAESASLVWLVVRMPDGRLPKQLLFGELREGVRSAGGQLKRFKDASKATMKVCHISASELEGLSQDRSAWRSAISAGTRRFQENRYAWLDARRVRRHLRREVTTSTDVSPCPECGRTFAEQIGLLSHSQGPPEMTTGGAGRIGRHLRLRRTSLSKCPRHFST